MHPSNEIKKKKNKVDLVDIPILMFLMANDNKKVNFCQKNFLELIYLMKLIFLIIFFSFLFGLDGKLRLIVLLPNLLSRERLIPEFGVYHLESVKKTRLHVPFNSSVLHQPQGRIMIFRIIQRQIILTTNLSLTSKISSTSHVCL